MKIYRNGIIILDLGYIPDDATENRTLMQEHSVSFSVELEENIPFRKGDYIIHSGEKFQLAEDVRPTVNENTGGFVYAFVFHHPSERLKDYIFKYEGDPKFDLFASGDQFLTLIINQSRLDLSVGEFPIESRNITFENVDLFSALNLIAEEYQMEWWIDNGLLNLGKCEFGEAISLTYDVEVKTISLSDSTERIITRLYAYGSDRNTGKPLQIPPIDLYPDMPEDQVIEGAVQFDVYPKQINKITSVETEILPETPDTQETYIYTIGADNTFTITPEEILPGKPLKISFLTGDLMGEDFELILRGDKFEIKFEEDNGVYTPNEFIKPNIGDEFFLYNIKAETIMPGLIQEAKDQLLIEATNFLEKTKHHYVYDISTHSIEALEKGIDLEIGQRVILSGPTTGVVESRIQSYSKDLNNRYDATYQVGENPQYSRLADIEKTALDNKYKILRSAGLTSDQIRILIRTIGKGEFISKTGDDTAQGFIQFLKGISVEELATLTQGIEIGDFTTGALGAGAAVKMIDGTSYAEVDNLTVRQKATFRELIIDSLKHIGGQLVLTPARMKCTRVVDGGTFYKCYFDTGDGEVTNEFVAGDYARCQVFTGSSQKFYWRLVTSVGDDWINLSKTTAAEGSDAPEAGDDIAQLGNATDTERQSAIILSTVGIDAPSWKQYSGINSFSLEGKDTTVFSKLGNKIQGKTVFTSGGVDLDEHLDGVAQDILDALRAAQEAEDKAQQAIEDAEANVATINTEVGKLQAQLDGEVSNWFYSYTPTLGNYPASEWTTNVIKDRHIGDTFTNTAQAPAENAGKSWRFVKDGSTYSWTVIADSDAVKALLEASKAQATADGKSTTHLFQPTKYKLGDMWVLNGDYTINGVVYKQGDLLTATQDSETFNEAHWLKRVRYTDDTKIDNLEIGGRNLIKNTDLNGIPYRYDHINKPMEGGLQLSSLGFSEPIVQPYQYTISMEIRGVSEVDIVLYRISTQGNSSITLIHNTDLTEEYKKVKLTFTPHQAQLTDLFIYTRYQATAYNAWFEIKPNSIKLEKGNKATDWAPAPEDVQAEINDAKQEALTAAGNAQNTANSLKDFTDTAFRDGIIDRSESVAIEKYKNTLNEAMAKAEASYMKVFLNTYLEGAAKTDLEHAKINLWGQRDTLLSAINTAISGGTTTPTQKTEVDDAFNDFNDLMKAFQNALEEANKAIQAKLDALSTEKVENLEIGGRNLILNSSFNGGNHWSGNAEIDSEVKFSNNNTLKFQELDTAIRVHKQIPVNSKYKAKQGDTFTLSFYVMTNDIENMSLIWLEKHPDSGYEPIGLLRIPEGTQNGEWVKMSVTYTINGDSTRAGLYIAKLDGTTPAFWISDIKIEKGNKATDWTPAPEDVEASIETAKTEAENAAQAYADAKSEAERILAEAYADGKVSAEEQARIDDVNAKLALAKAYAEAQDALLKTQQEAYADGEISKAEQAAIQAAKDYADLKKTEAEAYADGIVSDEEARAIADAQAKYEAAKAHAEQLVKDIEIGGRNLVLDSLNRIRIKSNSSSIVPIQDQAVSGENYRRFRRTYPEGITDNRISTYTDEFFTPEKSGYYTYSTYFRPNEFDIELRLLFGDSYGNFTLCKANEWTQISVTAWIEAGVATRLFGVHGVMPPEAVQWIDYNRVSITSGNKATDWTPAPEDVQAEIDAEKNRINDILSDNIADPSEKQYLSNLWQEIDAEYPRIGAQANTYAVDKTIYEQKYTALKNILDPVLANLTINSTVSGSSIRTAFSQYYDARTALQNAITDKANQNAADADAKAQALDYLKQAIGQDTEMKGALVTLVTMLLKQDMDADVTAGISGLQGAAKNLPAFWAGGTDVQAQQGTAKAIIRHDGTSKFEETQVSGSIVAKGNSGMKTELDASGIRVYNDEGKMNIRFGMKNGYAVLEYFDNNENPLYDLGPSGITEIEVREEKWTVFKRIYLGPNISTVLDSANRDKYKKSWQQTETTYYVYTSKISAGVNQDPLNDGVVFTSMSKTSPKMPIGFYCRRVPTGGVNMQYPNNGTNAIINSQLPYIQLGNENVYDRANIYFMDLEYYVNGKRSTSLYRAYWNETPGGEPPEIE